jgi:predicted dehydrogenase
VHGDKTQGDDNAILIIEFEGGVTALAEESWTKPGGMDDRAEVYGSQGVAYANLLQGNSILTYSAVGYDYAVEKAGSTKGWSFTMYEELWNYGFPQEFAHFVDCVANDKQPLVTGETDSPCSRPCLPPTLRPAPGEKYRCHFDPMQSGRSTCGWACQRRDRLRMPRHDDID